MRVYINPKRGMMFISTRNFPAICSAFACLTTFASVETRLVWSFGSA